jgi:outer membrane protein assembly factor BamA
VILSSKDPVFATNFRTMLLIDPLNRNLFLSNLAKVAISVCLGLVITASIPGQTSGRKITRIEAEGLKTLTLETVIATSGLKIGETFSVAELDAASERLVHSGFFTNVAYRTKTMGGNVTIVFQLEERKGNVSPVLFDNFIWFSDEELVEAVKAAVPSFDGQAPDTGNTVETIKQALQQLLVTRKLPGRVEYTLTETAHLYRVGDVPLKICTLHFPGSQNISEQRLIQATRSSMDPEYSRQSAATFPKYGLFPIYREAGQLRATFGAPIAKPDTNPGCEGGVDLTIPVNEGLIYSWAKAEWSGNQLLLPKDLDDALGMKTGEVANGKKFDKGLREVDKLYGTHGHIEAQFTSQVEFDDATRLATFRIAVKEGPQYRMGTVEFKGVSPTDAAALKDKWKLKSGEVFDQSYTNRFFREDAAVMLSRIYQERNLMKKESSPVDVRSDVNRQALTVNLIIEIKK